VIEFPAVPAGDPIRISASTFVVFRQCPASALARLAGQWGPESRPAFTGGLAHRIFAKHLNEEPIGREEFARVCRSEIGASNLNHKLGALGLKPSQLGRVIDEVGAMYQRFKKIPVEGFAGAEVAITVEPAEGVTLVGSIDAVFEGDTGARLVDWKTGELGDVGDQLGFYALLWSLERRELPNTVEAMSVKTGERVSELPDTATVAETAARVADMVEGVRGAWDSGTELDRRGGPWCGYCPLLDGCPEGRAATKIGSTS
jgi:hypothetical protein